MSSLLQLLNVGGELVDFIVREGLRGHDGIESFNGSGFGMENHGFYERSINPASASIRELRGLPPQSFEAGADGDGSVYAMAGETAFGIGEGVGGVERRQAFGGDVIHLVTDFDEGIHVLVRGAAILVADDVIDPGLVEMHVAGGEDKGKRHEVDVRSEDLKSVGHVFAGDGNVEGRTDGNDHLRGFETPHAGEEVDLIVLAAVLNDGAVFEDGHIRHAGGNACMQGEDGVGDEGDGEGDENGRDPERLLFNPANAFLMGKRRRCHSAFLL